MASDVCAPVPQRLDADPAYERFLRERRVEVLGRLGEAARRSGRRIGDVDVVAVSKTVGPEAVLAATGAGYEGFAENRPQELVRKLSAFEAAGLEAPRFDMIGNLQTNKVNQVLGRVRLIQSISSAHLAEAVSKRAERDGHVEAVLLECNVSGEESKGGFSPAGVREALDGLMGLRGLRIEGLMTMAPAHDASAARATFSGLRDLAEELRVASGLALSTLSCGMSDDFGIAVEEGSTLVRLGRIVFSPDYVLS